MTYKVTVVLWAACPIRSQNLLKILLAWHKYLLLCYSWVRKNIFSCPRLWWFENTWPMWSGTIRRCGLVGISVALLEEVHHCVGGFWSLLVLKLLSVWEENLLLAFCRRQFPSAVSHRDVEPLSSPAPCLPWCCHASCHDDNGLNF